MRKKERFKIMSDGLELYTVLYAPESPIGHVHLIHGMAEHIGRYEEFAIFLMNEGFAVSGHDQRGHGRTAERNGTVGFLAEEDGFHRIVQDTKEVVTSIQQELPDLPLTLFGHSMGSFVARRYMQLYSDTLSRVVFSGTGGDPQLPGKAGLAFAAAAASVQGKKAESPVLTKLTFGKFSKAFPDEESNYSWLSKDQDVVQAYIEDPYCGFIPTHQFFNDLFSGIFLVHDESKHGSIRKGLPVLFISGAEDPVGENGEGVFMAARQLSNAGLTNVTVYLAEKGRHELLNEINKERHFKTILRWLKMND